MTEKPFEAQLQLDPDVIDTFEIPKELADELSALLTKSSIRRSLMLEVINQPTKYEAMEELLLPVETRSMVLKQIITNQFVPEKYRSQAYTWHFPYSNGECIVWIKPTN